MELVSTDFDKAADWAEQIHDLKLKDKAKSEVVSYAARNFHSDEAKMQRVLSILASISSDLVRSKCADRLLKNLKIDAIQKHVLSHHLIVDAEKRTSNHTRRDMGHLSIINGMQRQA